jgi:hypothetical protein
MNFGKLFTSLLRHKKSSETLNVDDTPASNLYSLGALQINDLNQLKRTLLRGQIYSKWSLTDLIFNIRLPDEKKICPLCKYESEYSRLNQLKSHCIFGGGQLLRYICPNCEVIYGPDKMLELNAKELAEDYEWHYSAYDEGDSTDRELKTFFTLNPEKSGLYLNYGAGGWSNSVVELRNRGWNVYAYEPHSSASQGQRDENWLITSISQLNQHKFSGIFSNNVLEHFRNPIQELKNMSLLLMPGGKMAHATPCFEYSYEYTRFHLFFFTGKSKKYLIEQADLFLTEEIVDGDYICCIMKPAS